MALVSLTGLSTPKVGAVALDVAPPGGSNAAPATKVMDALTKFIPTELLAPYVAALSLSESQHWSTLNIYVCFIIATPFVYLLFEFVRVATEGRKRPDFLPLLWRCLAAPLAFAVWGLAAPTNSVQASIGGPGVAGFLATLISPVLTGVDTIVFWALGIDPKNLGG